VIIGGNDFSAGHTASPGGLFTAFRQQLIGLLTASCAPQLS
jgi:hypothetical protein